MESEAVEREKSDERWQMATSPGKANQIFTENKFKSRPNFAGVLERRLLGSNQ